MVSVTVCDVCGATVPAGVAACSRCGTAIATGPPTEWASADRARPDLGSVSPWAPPVPATGSSGRGAPSMVLAFVAIVVFVGALGAAGLLWLSHRSSDPSTDAAPVAGTSTTDATATTTPVTGEDPAPLSSTDDSDETVPGEPPWACADRQTFTPAGRPLQADQFSPSPEAAASTRASQYPSSVLVVLNRESGHVLFAVVDPSNRMHAEVEVDQYPEGWAVGPYATCPS
jgi:hypothetical protein